MRRAAPSPIPALVLLAACRSLGHGAAAEVLASDLGVAAVSITGAPTESLGDVDVLRGEITTTAGGTPVPAWFAIAPLGGRLSGARVTTAMDGDGNVVRLGAAGHAEFDRDELGRWRHFLKRLQRNAATRAPRTLTDAGIDDAMAAIERRSDDEARLARLLARTHLGMSRISMLVEQLARCIDTGVAMPPDWIEPVIGDLEALRDGADALAPVIGGRSATAMAASAGHAAGFFEELRSMVGSGPPAAVREFVRTHIRAGLCSTCHHGRCDGSDTEWQPALQEHARSMGIPRGVLRVGHDVPAAFGDDGRVSAAVAAAVRAGIRALDARR